MSMRAYNFAQCILLNVIETLEQTPFVVGNINKHASVISMYSTKSIIYFKFVFLFVQVRLEILSSRHQKASGIYFYIITSITGSIIQVVCFHTCRM